MRNKAWKLFEKLAKFNDSRFASTPRLFCEKRLIYARCEGQRTTNPWVY